MRFRPVSDHAWIRAARSDAATRQGGRCRYCRDRLTRANITAEHLQPVSHGGSLTASRNIGASCRPCNNAKGAMTDAVFLRAVKSAPGNPPPLAVRRAWMRRRINLAVERACDRLRRYAA